MSDIILELKALKRSFTQGEVTIDVLRGVAAPFDSEGGLRRLDGNLGRAIVKVSAVAPEHRAITAPAKATPTQACHSPGATCASSSLAGMACSCATENQTAATNRNMPSQPRGNPRSRYSPVKNRARPTPANANHVTNRERGEKRSIDVISSGPNVMQTLH